MKKQADINLTYEEALSELEEIRDALEDDLVSVDLLSEKVSRAYLLIDFCKSKLIKTEKELNSFSEEGKPE